MLSVRARRRRGVGGPRDRALSNAIAKVDAWYADGGRRRDLTNRDIAKPGIYQHKDAITIMDAWWPKLLAAEFQPTLGKPVFDQLQVMIGFGAPTPGSQPAAPDFEVGWYGFVSNDLRDLLPHQRVGDGRLHLDPAVPVPEPAHLPAGHRADAEAGSLSV